MEVSVEKCQGMIDEAKKAGKMLIIGYRCQYDPNHLECKRLAADKVFGNLKSIEAGFSRGISATEWRVKKALAGGGPLMDVGIYALQTCRFVSGEEPTEVSAKFGPIDDPVKFAEVEESVEWDMTFPSGLKTHCVTNYQAGGNNGFVANVRAGSGMQVARRAEPAATAERSRCRGSISLRRRWMTLRSASCRTK